MISKKMAKTLNEQINAELYSAYLYFAMSAVASHSNLSGTARWFFAQAIEETSHAHKIYDYLQDVGEAAVLDAIAKPPATWKSALAMFEDALEHEKKVTKMINNLMNQAIEEKDNATSIFLQWFVTEQVEEEKSVSEIIARLQMAGNQTGPLLMIDRELGSRSAKD